MLHKIRSLINQLLDDLASVYKSNGIRYPVNQYYSALIRMLSPVQLNAVLDRHQLSGLFENKVPNKYENKSELDMRRIQQMKNSIANKYTKASFQNQQYVQIKSNLIQSQSDNVHIDATLKRPRHTVRSRGLEDAIVLWILGEFERNRTVTKLGIMNKGRQLGKSTHFKASPRWCDIFLNRHPQIRGMLNLQRNQQNAKKRYLSSKKNQNQRNSANAISKPYTENGKNVQSGMQQQKQQNNLNVKQLDEKQKQDENLEDQYYDESGDEQQSKQKQQYYDSQYYCGSDQNQQNQN